MATHKDTSSPAQEPAPPQTPAQNAMKQFSKTPAERGEPSDSAGAGPAPRPPPSAGDAPVGQTDNQGSSPYADRSRKEASRRER